MIYIDIDGVCVDFIGTARKFGIELKPNEFGRWNWGTGGCPTPEEFYKAAEPQPWLWELMQCFRQTPTDFITADCGQEKCVWIYREVTFPSGAIEAPDKSLYCRHPTDLLIDDCAEECQKWRKKGGMAWWLNLANEDPFGKFLKWWRLGE